MQRVPHTGCLPIAQSPPARHATAKAQLLRQLLPGDARAQHEQDAVERHLIAHPRTSALGRGRKCRQQRFDLLEQWRADFFVLVSTHSSPNAHHALGDDTVLLAALNDFPPWHSDAIGQ